MNSSVTPSIINQELPINANRYEAPQKRGEKMPEKWADKKCTRNTFRSKCNPNSLQRRTERNYLFDVLLGTYFLDGAKRPLGCHKTPQNYKTNWDKDVSWPIVWCFFNMLQSMAVRCYSVLSLRLKKGCTYFRGELYLLVVLLLLRSILQSAISALSFHARSDKFCENALELAHPVNPNL